MQKIILIAAGILIGLVVSSYIPNMSLFGGSNAEMTTSMDGHDHDHDHAVMHSHESVEVLDIDTAPTIELQADADSKSGYNLRLVTDNFTFTPEAVGGESIQGQGHAHVYVNGTKIARVYGEWFHVPVETLTAGENVISASLNANDHSQWAIENQPIQAEVVVMQ